MYRIENRGVTRSIPAELGTDFGIKYIIEGEPRGGRAWVTQVLKFPSPGLRKPGIPGAVLEDRYEQPKSIATEHYRGFGFLEPWEIVPGIWTFEIWYEGRKLAEESFTVGESTQRYRSCDQIMSQR